MYACVKFDCFHAELLLVGCTRKVNPWAAVLLPCLHPHLTSFVTIAYIHSWPSNLCIVRTVNQPELHQASRLSTHHGYQIFPYKVSVETYWALRVANSNRHGSYRLCLKNSTRRSLNAGHSLGGALATLAAFDIRQQLLDNNQRDTKVVCYTFAAPRTGNHAFAKEYNAMVPDTWSVINDQVRALQ